MVLTMKTFIVLFLLLSHISFAYEQLTLFSGNRPVTVHRLYPCFTVATEFSFSPKSPLFDDYENVSSNPNIYNFNFEAGYCFSRLFTGMGDNYNSHIRQFGVLIGTSHFRSGFDKKDENIVFSNDKSQTPYLVDRSFVHNTHYVTLRTFTSVQFDFMPKHLLLVAGVKFGYKYSEEYQDYLRSKEKVQSEYLPFHTIRQTEDNIYEYLIHKPAKPEDVLLYGFNIGLAYQIPVNYELEEEESPHPYSEHIDIAVGMNYHKANILGLGIIDYQFYGINFRFTFRY
mgnify:FL=1